MTYFVTLEICIITLASSVWCKVCSAMRCTNEQEECSRAHMMNEKKKSFRKAWSEIRRGKKNLSHVAEVGKWGWFHFLLSWQMSGTACKGLEGKCACKMQKFMKKHKLILSSAQFYYDIILSSLTPCYFPLISQSFL